MNKAQAQALLDGMTPGPWQTKNDYVPDCLTVIADVDGEIHGDGSTTFSFAHIATCQDEFGEATLDAAGNAAAIASLPDILKALIAKIEDNERLTEALAALVEHTSECERSLDEELHQVHHSGESLPLTNARATLSEATPTEGE